MKRKLPLLTLAACIMLGALSIVFSTPKSHDASLLLRNVEAMAQNGEGGLKECVILAGYCTRIINGELITTPGISIEF